MSDQPDAPGAPRMAWLTAVHNPITPFMRQLTDCVCRGFATAGRPVCVCSRYAGDGPAPADDCTCQCTVLVEDPGGGGTVQLAGQGQAWVRWQEMAGQSYNRRSARTLGNRTGWGACETEQPWYLIVEYGVYRCVSTPSDSGRPPSEQQQTADAEAADQDLAILRHIFDCCPVLAERAPDRQLDRAEPVGPEGGCFGVRLSFWTELIEPSPESDPDLGFGDLPGGWAAGG